MSKVGELYNRYFHAPSWRELNYTYNYAKDQGNLNNFETALANRTKHSILAFGASAGLTLLFSLIYDSSLLSSVAENPIKGLAIAAGALALKKTYDVVKMRPFLFASGNVNARRRL